MVKMLYSPIGLWDLGSHITGVQRQQLCFWVMFEAWTLVLVRQASTQLCSLEHILPGKAHVAFIFFNC